MMILLVCGATRTMARLIQHPNLGVLLTPKSANSAPPRGVLWACDNSAYTDPSSKATSRRAGFDDHAFREMLNRLRERPDCRWVASPDVVGDHSATMALWDKWAHTIRDHGQSPGFVAQDGCTVESLPWSDMGAVFIGGSTRFKLGSEAARIVHAARKRNLWVHMGRVNTMRRLLYAHVLGVTSIDGSKFSRFSETYIPQTLDFLAQLDRQRMFQAGEAL